MSDDPITTCQVCGAPVERVFHPVAVHFKGSGFYSTDYGKKRAGAAAGDSTGDSGNGSKGESAKSDSAKSDSGGGDAGGSAKKTDTKSSSSD
jgi:predicted nucleic acid-binding Zn ribbon protein